MSRARRRPASTVDGRRSRTLGGRRPALGRRRPCVASPVRRGRALEPGRAVGRGRSLRRVGPGPAPPGSQSRSDRAHPWEPVTPGHRPVASGRRPPGRRPSGGGQPRPRQRPPPPHQPGPARAHAQPPPTTTETVVGRPTTTTPCRNRIHHGHPRPRPSTQTTPPRPAPTEDPNPGDPRPAPRPTRGSAKLPDDLQAESDRFCAERLKRRHDTRTGQRHRSAIAASRTATDTLPPHHLPAPSNHTGTKKRPAKLAGRKLNPAATYSPRPLRAKYHRR